MIIFLLFCGQYTNKVGCLLTFSLVYPQLQPITICLCFQSYQQSRQQDYTVNLFELYTLRAISRRRKTTNLEAIGSLGEQKNVKWFSSWAAQAGRRFTVCPGLRVKQSPAIFYLQGPPGGFRWGQTGRWGSKQLWFQGPSRRDTNFNIQSSSHFELCFFRMKEEDFHFTLWMNQQEKWKSDIFRLQW